ncbi:hypothetical protein NL108_000756 [Boleophthalmus pectinirostris]|uniref:macrophage mannose receptor 1-like n=1 Tax=Boleophthalmus pectinirostris TaxID=150288 RepID=UPI00242DBEC0|nr:macrophage mannose receptor 1-like [Boleophthalmus pectinirostris]KAJ0056947.1 hypothetical protein NL108_000756 [Boleophthalmus pectinirostris]
MPTVWVGLTKTLDNKEDEPKCPSTSGVMNCSDRLFFKCNSSDIKSNVKLNWCAAKQYCRYHSLGDLATNESSANTTDSLWISGNITDDWKWDDGGCSTYREWSSPFDEEQNDTAATLGESYELKPQSSDLEFEAVCSTGDTRIVIVNIPKTWEQALEYCDKHHSGLLQIPTREHQESVEQWFNATEQNGTFWVGLRQSQVFGFWMWKDTIVSTNNWENGMPMLPMSHECGVMVVPGLKWRDHNCLYPLPFICQENIVWLNSSFVYH